MVYESDREPKENEVSAWTVAVGNFPMPWTSKKKKQKAEKALEIIRELDGLYGVTPMPPHGTLLLFDTLNHAKIGSNILISKGIKTGSSICEVFVDKAYITSHISP